MPTDGKRVDRAGQSKTSLVLTKTVDDRDVDTTDYISVNFVEVFKIPEVAIDLDVEVTTILTEEEGQTFPRASDGEIEVDVVDLHFLPRAAGEPGILNLGVTATSVTPLEIAPLELLNSDDDARVGKRVPDMVLCP